MGDSGVARGRKILFGGLALFCGVMMRRRGRFAVSVRDSAGGISHALCDIPSRSSGKKSGAIHKYLRGIFTIADSLSFNIRLISLSYKLHNRGEKNPPLFRKILLYALLISALCAGYLFCFYSLKDYLLSFVDGFMRESYAGYLLVSAASALYEFIAALLLLFVLKQLRPIRVCFSYHGAEHMAINCSEAGYETTVENVRRHSRFHTRCGTSIAVNAIIIYLILTLFIPPSLPLYVELALCAVAALVSIDLGYESTLRASNKSGRLAKFISLPGLMVQRLTTAIPDDTMLECACDAIHTLLSSEENVK